MKDTVIISQEDWMFVLASLDMIAKYASEHKDRANKISTEIKTQLDLLPLPC